MKPILILICLALFVVACQDDSLKFYQPSDFKGRLLLDDEWTETSGAIAAEATVYLSEKELKSINDKYLFTTKADKDGIFVFSNLPNDQKDVWLTARYTGSNGIVYEKQHELADLPKNANGETEIKLNPIYPKGMIKVTWKEGVQPVVGAEVYLFTNSNQSTTIGNATPDGFVQKTTTNAKGVAFFYGLDVANYYVMARTKAGGITAIPNVTSVSIAQADVEGAAKTAKPVTLSFPTVSSNPSIDVTVKMTTISSEPLARFYVYLFVNEEQAKTVHDRRVRGYVLMDSTNVEGQVSLKNLKEQKYYVGVRGVVGGNVSKAEYKSATLTNNTPVPLDFTFN